MFVKTPTLNKTFILYTLYPTFNNGAGEEAIFNHNCFGKK